MNTQSNAMNESSLGSAIIASSSISPSRRLYWSVRRELWENRSIYLAPAAVAALIVVGFLISAIHRPDSLVATPGLDAMQQHEVIVRPYNFAALLIMGTTFLVTMFYCLGALQAERRDRSILFWKSLPVSDLTTVLSKASVPIVIIPLLTFAITVVTQWMMLLLASAVLLARGESVATLWHHLMLFQMWFMLLYHLVTIHALWYAPIYGWLLLVSAWARRAAFLWALLPPLAIGTVERIAFNTSHLEAILQGRLGGGAEGNSFAMGGMSMDAIAQLTPARFLMSPGLWLGLALAALFLAGAVWLRRDHGPI